MNSEVSEMQHYWNVKLLGYDTSESTYLFTNFTKQSHICFKHNIDVTYLFEKQLFEGIIIVGSFENHGGSWVNRLLCVGRGFHQCICLLWFQVERPIFGFLRIFWLENSFLVLSRAIWCHLTLKETRPASTHNLLLGGYPHGRPNLELRPV